MNCYQCRKEIDTFVIKNGKQLKICLKCYSNIYCSHKKEKRKCLQCNGTQICPHDKNKYRCKLCSNKKGSFCTHNREKFDCVDCKGLGVCEHSRRKRTCKECKGSQICTHNTIKSICIECKGSQRCIHLKIKYECKECNGGAYCEHKIKERVCGICNPQSHLISLQRRRINYILKKSGNLKQKTIIEYIGCTARFLYEHIQKQLTEQMKLEGYEIDHIKPICKFNLKDPEELKQCTHWTNLRPLLKKDNRNKGGKWSQQDDTNWKIITHGYRQTMIV
jgi:hypothetical protein